MAEYGQDILIYKYLLDDKTYQYLNNFDSGKPDIDEYFKNEALNDSGSVTYMYVDMTTNIVIALAAVSCASIPVFNNNDDISENIPAMEIKYFALNEKLHHVPYTRNSRTKLSHCVHCYLIEHLKKVSIESVGAVKIVLQAMPEAVGFYSKCKFKEMTPYVSDNAVGEDDGCIPMFYDLKELGED